ncbi:MAG: glycosyltransferase family 4 protein [Micavibrio sp.]
MRILIVSDAWLPQINGVVRTYEDLNRHLEMDGHSVRVIGPAEFPLRRPLPGYHEIELVFFPARTLARLVDDFAPDSIHIATEGPLGWAMQRLCRKRGWPFTTAYHTHFPDYVALRAAKIIPVLFKPVRALCIHLVRRFHRDSSAVMTTTGSVDDTLLAWKFASRLHRLTRGVNTAIFHPGPKTLFTDLPRPIALYVGRVAIEKNIQAFLTMPWAGSKIVVGDGPMLPALKTAYPKTVFAGKQTANALAEHFRAADVFVFPSRTDTFGLVLIEALACGLPLAGYPVTGPVDIVTDETLGAMDEDLGKAAAKALASPGTPERRFEHVQKTYSWPVATGQFIAAQTAALIEKK